MLRGLLRLRLALLDSFASNGASNDIPRNDITPDNHNDKEITVNQRLPLKAGRPIFFLTFVIICDIIKKVSYMVCINKGGKRETPGMGPIFG
ncbi:hypothetical protein CH333_06025 [candidate division WOR-3 bacterium JGI_Cruoil_03_44_89]|uniref:Uncharacterized protein n=1 Tax=candidate division WOR-3 bacterium JGI_Cruoil_03_44_89 TaxID=1973748 RepID=A0A235BU85_UNCW3|nr:MAG: hypothetical protein CH333_06025 [candidate division WOR-3 bacterium JGI_Cruoil_03_44_89]